MNITELMCRIRALGYRFELLGNDVKFTHTRGEQTPREVIPIFKQFKERKHELVEYLKKAEQQKTEVQTVFRKCKRCGNEATRFCYDSYYRRNEPACNWFCEVCEPFKYN